MRGLAWVLCLVGCSGSSTGDVAETDATDATETDTTGTDTTETDTDTTGTTDTSARLTGTISGSSGPLVDVDLRLCRGLACRNGLTDGAGAFAFDAVAVDWHSFEVVAPDGSGYATAFAPLQFQTDEERAVDVVLVSATSHDLPTTPGDVEVAPGVHLTVGDGELEPPTPFDPAPTAITGAEVPQAAWVPTDGIAGTVLGMWYVGPFDTPAAPAAGLPISFDDVWSLTDGTTLRVFVASYESSSWVDAGTVTASSGVLSGDAALPLLSTVILVQE